ncbi:MAG: hypothetical protein GY936_13300 [Ignavibacteriae bacterium]|nr:hypothetical protein [Ignavibacteriota bacterium]
MNQKTMKYATWSLSTSCLFVGLAWGFFEGTFFFIVPDIIITFVAMFSFKKSVQQMLFVLLGSLLAGLLMFYLGKINYQLAKSIVLNVPFVGDEMFATVKQQYETSGIWALCKGPMSGIPYKIFAIQAYKYSNLLIFLLISIPARLERVVITWGLFAIYGYFCKNRVKRFEMISVNIHLIYWIIVYAFYWTKI